MRNVPSSEFRVSSSVRTNMSRLLLITLLILVGMAACSRRSSDVASNKSAATEPPRISSETLVKAAVQPVELPVDGSADATVNVTVQNGYHINANPASFPYLKATELDIPAGEEVFICRPAATRLRGRNANQGLVAGRENCRKGSTIRVCHFAHPSLRRSGVLPSGFYCRCNSGVSKVKTLWLIVAVTLAMVAVVFMWRGNFDVAFVAAVLGVVAWFLNYRTQARAVIAAIDAEQDDETRNLDNE